MNKLSKDSLTPDDRKAVEMIARGAGEIMFYNYKNLPMDYRMRLEDVIKNAYRILDDKHWMTS
jgi:hypothetical protein